MTVWTVAIPKGGSTKSTTASELALALAQRGSRVLAVDADQQGTLGRRLGVTPATEVGGVTADVLTGQSDLEESLVPSPTVEGVELLVGTHHLTDLELRPELIAGMAQAMRAAGEKGDVVIDTPPAIGPVTLAALIAADHIVVPLAVEVEAVDELGRFEQVIASRVAPQRPDAGISWVIPTRHDARRVLDREIMALLHERYGSRVTQPVREAVAVREAFVAGLPVTAWDPTSPVAGDYAAALAPILASKEN